ncbi:1,4-alpha-glucan branching protein GlgB [Nitratifractor salsuginis]|uniref:1,4-alpha-glucan branching enzyme GlgB n=1 Tax=Nitratifractor salsuginis (strain DSM 16511 / JCM 12458 / E9I37-1) TaxID=749222 RepID=E6X3G7_NITSE|nr:1,4-alpha-glucan branching protein GlgB [Nitratifractor salsuginis]ADV46244.1 1,4-alpha-glucan branching enzyme [Nitratifractor salsuginis DSM 16511]
MIHYDVTRFTETDIYLFREGTHTKLYEKFGAHFMEREGTEGVYFAVWAPHAKRVSVVGDFNHYDPRTHSLKKREDGSGIWEGFIESISQGVTYKYHIRTPYDTELYKADPFAFATERPPNSASKVWCLEGYLWEDEAWMEQRAKSSLHQAPMNIYEVHLGSWRRHLDGSYLSYEEAAEALAEYLTEMNYTHVELMPITEYPFKGSWGYQVSGYFAPTARFGTPQECMALVDRLHAAGIGVIMDWVPSHFVTDGHGLIAFDGTALYEYEDPRKGYHPEWKSAVFDYGKGEVRSFLISSAHFWLDYYHIDGIRVDAVASMLYLDYARKEGEWVPNIHGGNENLEAIEFLRMLNASCYADFPGIAMIAEESTAFPGVTRPVDAGGLGFGFKWNMGWMHDTLKYFKTDPLFRKYHHNRITFSMWYAYDENFILPLSHDEVVHMKGSLLNKMPGDTNQKFANLRALFGYMISHPGKKLLFMGGEIGQWKEWDYEDQLEWYLLENPLHAGLQSMLATLDRLYREHPALYAWDEKREGFEWINERDAERSVLSYLRRGPGEEILVVCNFADARHEGYLLPLPETSEWEPLFSTQDPQWQGWEAPPSETLQSRPEACCGREHSLRLDLPALGVLYFRRASTGEDR